MDKLKDFLGSASWKTSLAGVAQILASAATVAKMLATGAYDQNVLTLAITGFISGVGLILAKDKNVIGAPPTDKAK